MCVMNWQEKVQRSDTSINKKGTGIACLRAPSAIEEQDTRIVSFSVLLCLLYSRMFSYCPQTIHLDQSIGNIMGFATDYLRILSPLHLIATVCWVGIALLTIIQPCTVIAQTETSVPLCGNFHATDHIPDGPHTFVDRFNRPWTAPAHLIAEQKPGAALLASCSVFRIEFEDVILGNGIGFDDRTPTVHPVLGSTTRGAVRRQTLCEVFRYIENTISVNGTPDVLVAESYKIPTGFIAAASSFYPTGQINGLVGGTMYDHINTGVDPTPAAGDYDAFMVFSFGYAMHDDWNTAPGNSIDLYSVALHEATHTLGFASLIGADGTSKIGGPYSRFDRLLRNAAGDPLIEPLLFTFIGTQADLVSDRINFHGDQCEYPSPVYSAATFQPGSSLSHFDGLRSGVQYVMRPSTAGGSDRILTTEELRVLCELGYKLQNNGCALCVPSGRLDMASTEPGKKICFDVLANDINPDGSTLQIDPGSIRIAAGSGTISIEGGLLCFTPDPNYTGLATIIYRPGNGTATGDETRFLVSVVKQHLFSSCDEDSLLIRTGWDFAADQVEDYGAATSYWTIVEDPDPQTIEPRQAIAAYTYNGWREPLPSSRWISAAGPVASVNAHGEYHFEMQFCLSTVPNELRMVLDYLVDDLGEVRVNDVVVRTTRNGYAFRDPPLSIDMNIAPFVHPGRNTITLVADNSGGVAMGVNAAGYLLPDEPTIFRCGTVQISEDVSICRGNSTQLMARGGINYQWSPEQGLSCADCPTPVASPDRTTTYHVRAIDSSGCSFENSVTVTVTENDVDAGPDRTICSDTEVQLNATGGDSYQWTPPTGLSCTDCPDPVASPTRTRTYYVIGTDATGCNGLDSVTIQVDEDCISEDVRICRGSSTQLRVRDGISYQWSPAQGLSCADCPTPVASPDRTTTYHVRVIDSSGYSFEDSVTVTVLEANVDAGPDRTICSSTEIQLQATGGESYQWSPSTELSCTDCADPIASPTRTRTYYVTGTDSAGCKGVDSVTIQVDENCIDAGQDIRLCRGDTVQLSVAGWESYQWSPADGLSCDDCPEPLAYPDKTTVYRVKGIASDGTSATDSVVVEVVEPTILRVRTAQFNERLQTNSLTVPIVLVDKADGLGITRLRFTIQYDPFVLNIAPTRIKSSLQNRLLRNWDVAYTENNPGELVIIFTAPQGVELVDSGELFALEATLFLSTHPESELAIQLEALEDNPCVEFLPENGVVRPEICGGTLRLIEFSSGKYALGPATPNPSSGNVSIQFALGLDGPTRLDIVDMNGNHTATLINSVLDTGDYEVELDSRSLPPGTYFYRLRSGTWEQTGRMVLVR